jgi:hypothetical protein
LIAIVLSSKGFVQLHSRKAFLVDKLLQSQFDFFSVFVKGCCSVVINTLFDLLSVFFCGLTTNGGIGTSNLPHSVDSPSITL